ncbi:MAG: hypothetical protein JNM56_25785 [Planctomycetia bacterium]|nr:hypothetical protein [Planctomycetia bacterium]
MRRLRGMIYLAALTVVLGLTQTASAVDPEEVCIENPVYIALGPDSYGMVFEKVIDVLNEYFEIAYSNRYDGRIETFPRIAPGYEQPWKPSTPSWYERLLATFQTIRHRAFVLIQLADDGGFFVQVIVYKELEDLPRPLRSTAGAAIFRGSSTVDRQYEVIDPTVFERAWIPMGRDHLLEHAIAQKIKNCL